MRKRGWKKFANKEVFLFSLLVVYGTALIGSFFTYSGTNSDWYQQIKPAITPPNYVFPIVWNLLFFLIACSIYFSWIKSSKKQKFRISSLFGVNLILNALWSFLFFKLQNPALAFFDLILLWISIPALILTTRKISATASYLLIPYFLWVSFAGVLNYLIIIK